MLDFEQRCVGNPHHREGTTVKVSARLDDPKIELRERDDCTTINRPLKTMSGEIEVEMRIHPREPDKEFAAIDISDEDGRYLNIFIYSSGEITVHSSKGNLKI
jgi:hypothetical protein